MDKDAVLDKTKKELRSLLISAPRGVALTLLAKDYKMVMGKELPYRQFGYRNIEEFIRSVPDTIRVGLGPAGETCYAVANAETQQIARFVASQKKPALKKSLRPPPAVSRNTVKMSGFSKKNNFGPANSRWRRTGHSGSAGGKWGASGSSSGGMDRQYVPAGGERGGGGGGSVFGSSKFGKVFIAKQPSGKCVCVCVCVCMCVCVCVYVCVNFVFGNFYCTCTLHACTCMHVQCTYM